MGHPDIRGRHEAHKHAQEMAALSGHTGLWVPAGWGAAWAAAKQAASSRRVVAAVVGHSIGRGWSTDLDVDGWVALLRADLQAEHGDGGSGWRGVVDSELVVGSAINTWDNRGQVSAGWTEYFGAGKQDGPGATTVLSDNTAGRTWTFPGLRGKSLRTFHAQAPGNGSYTLRINNGAPSAAVVTDGALSVQSSPVQTAASDESRLHLTTSGGAGVVLYGCEAVNDVGIVVDNYAKSGGKASDFVGSGTFGQSPDWNGGQYRPCDLLIYSLDLGDVAANTAPDVYLANVRQHIERVRGLGPKHGMTEILFVLNHAGHLDDVNRVAAAYSERIRALAETYGAAVVNMWAQGYNSYDHWADLGHWGTDYVTTGEVGTSDVHLSAAGQRAIYDALTRVPGLLG